ncbi:MAG: hypothetical protein ACYSU3_23805 [Planctomycetota bacterium]|jgi:hypothetical protein
MFRKADGKAGMIQETALHTYDIKRIVTALRLIFWGGIICVFDFKINGFDIINDVIGAIMIAWGVFRLSNLSVHPNYRVAMLFVKIISILYIAEAIGAHFHYRIPGLMAFVIHSYRIAKMLATVVFCVAMLWFCRTAGLPRSEKSWKITAILFGVIYFIPWGLLHFVWIICLVTGKHFSFNLGPAALLILFVFIVPLIHLFISTSRMKTEAALRLENADSNQQSALNEQNGLGPNRDSHIDEHSGD